MDENDKNGDSPKQPRLTTESGRYEYMGYAPTVTITCAAKTLFEAAKSTSEISMILRIYTLLWQQKDSILAVLATNPTPSLIRELDLPENRLGDIKALVELVKANKTKSRNMIFDWAMKLGLGALLTLLVTFGITLFI